MNKHECSHQWFQTFQMMEDNIHRCIKCGYWETKQNFAYMKRKPLTNEQIDSAWRSVDYTQSYENFRIAIARAIERAHGIGEE